MSMLGSVARALVQRVLSNRRVERQLQWWGYRISRTTAPELAPFDLALKAALGHYRISCVLDVGANTGQFGQRLRRLGYRGRIVSFEPVSANLVLLNETAERFPPWSVQQIGLGDIPGELVINVSNHGVFSSFLTPNSFARNAFGDDVEVSARESVRIERLDDVFTDIVRPVRGERMLLKLDTQGYDLKVVAGASRSLEWIDVLLSELSMIPIYDGMPSYREALATYEELGYLPSVFECVTADVALHGIEFDCLLVRPPQATTSTDS
jgi:FkbM family methyltransferase